MNNLQQSLFRENSLKRFQTPDDLNTTLKIMSPSAWCWVMFSLFLLTGILIWIFFARLSMVVTSSGIILPGEYYQAAENLIDEHIAEGQARLATLKRIYEAKRQLFIKHYLTLPELEQANQEYLAAKSDLNTEKSINPYLLRPISASKFLHNSDYYALLFVKSSEGKKINAGMQVKIHPTIFSDFEFKNIKGQVVKISKYPVSKEIAYSYLGNMNLVEEYFLSGSPFLVTVKLENIINKDLVNSIDSGSIVTAKIIYKISTPFELFFN